MTVFAVRLEVLLALFADREWRERFDRARNTAEMRQVIVEFGEAKGWKVVEVAT